MPSIQNKTFQVQSISLPKGLIIRANKVAKKYEMTRSDLYRRAIERYIHKLNWEKIREYGANKASQLRIHTEDQVVDLIHEWRKEQKIKK
jgi:metal-responsive CopG/Arc/MetJ family transcriptional regulator